MIKQVLRLIIVSLVFSATGAFTQTTSVDFGPSREDVMKLVDLLQTRRNMALIVEQMKLQMKKDMRLQSSARQLTPQQQSRRDQIVDAAFSKFPTNELIDAMVPIYQRHLTREDIDAMIAFYSTPTGQKIIRDMPALISESMQVATEVAARKIIGIRKNIDEQIRQIQGGDN